MGRIARSKACPFCRSDDSFVECIDFGSFAVVCNSCGARGPTADGDGCDDEAENFAGRRNAVREWNKRQRTPTTSTSTADVGGGAAITLTPDTTTDGSAAEPVTRSGMPPPPFSEGNHP